MSASPRCSTGWSAGAWRWSTTGPGVTRDRREGEARLGDLDFTIIDTAGLEERRRRESRRPHAGADQDRDRAGRRGVLRDRRQDRADAGRPRLRRSGAALRQAGDRGRQQGRGQGQRRPACSKPTSSVSAIRSASRPSTARGWSICSRRCARRCRKRPASRRPMRRRMCRRGIAPDPRRRGRPAELRQVDAGQPAARRGAHADRARGRPHPRHHRGRPDLAGAATSACTTPPACGARRASRRSSRSFRSPTPSTPSVSPRWWWC